MKGSTDRVEVEGRGAAGGVRVLQAHAVGVEYLGRDGLLLDLVAARSPHRAGERRVGRAGEDGRAMEDELRATLAQHCHCAGNGPCGRKRE